MKRASTPGDVVKRAIFCLLVLVWAPACGPLVYSVTATQAKRALQRAEAAKAEVRDPYNYWRATAFLEKAKEEAGYSDYQPAIKYSRIAKASALKAVENSKKQSSTRGPNEKK